jgi:glycosyltransferase involved in cell wall biosynthesis
MVRYIQKNGQLSFEKSIKMNKILNINSYHYRRGGSDVVYLEHAQLLSELGWESGFFSMSHPKNFDTPWSKYFIDELEFGSDYSAVQKISMAIKSIYSFEAQKKLRVLIDEFKPDIAHSHCIYHHLSPSIFPVLKERGIPSVMTAHDLKIACPAYKMLNNSGICEKCKSGSVLNVVKNKCIRNSLAASAIVTIESAIQRHFEIYKRNLDAVVVPSKFFMNKFVEWGWSKDRFTYIPNYVDSEAFEPNFMPGDYFLYFGRLAPEKGVATLIKAAIAAKVKVKIVGTGPIESELKELHNALGHDSNIEFLGYKSGSELHDLIWQSRAVVLPSEWYENAPMSVLESFAMGKPVIGADIGGIPEMVLHGQTGWTFESANVLALTELLSNVKASSADSLATLGKNARDFVSSNFTRKRYTEEILSLYSRLGVTI